MDTAPRERLSSMTEICRQKISDNLSFDDPQAVLDQTHFISIAARKEEPRQSLIFALPFLARNLDRFPSAPFIRTATLKAICNLCYEQEDACRLLHESGTARIIFGLIRRIILHPEDHEETSGRQIAVSCLCNVLHTCPELQLDALRDGVMDIFITIMRDPEFSDLLPNSIGCISSIAENVGKDAVDHLLNDNFLRTVADVLSNRDDLLDGEDTEELLSILRSLCEKDEDKLTIMQSEISPQLLRLISRVDAEDTAKKSAVSLLIELLTFPPCVDHLISAPDGLESILRLIGEIILSDVNIDLRTSAILLLGNLCKDEVICGKIYHASHKDGSSWSSYLLDWLLDSVSITDLVSRAMPLDEAAALMNSAVSEQDANEFQFQYAVISAIKNLLVPIPLRLELIRDDDFSSLVNIVCRFPSDNQPKPASCPILLKLLTVAVMILKVCPESDFQTEWSTLLIPRLALWISSQNNAISMASFALFGYLQKNRTNAADGFQFEEKTLDILLNGTELQRKIVLQSLRNYPADVLRSFAVLPRFAEAFETCLKDSVDRENALLAADILSKLPSNTRDAFSSLLEKPV